MSHPAGCSLDKTMPSQGIALQRQKGLASIHRNIGMPPCHFIHIKDWILHVLIVVCSPFFAFCLFLLASSSLFLFLVVLYSFVVYLRRQGRRAAFFFFSIFARQGREMLGGTAVRNLQRQSTSGSCLWMSVSLLLLLDAPEDILHEWCLAACAFPPRRQRCCDATAFTETCGLFPLSFILFLMTHVCEEDANDCASMPSVVCLVRHGSLCWYFLQKLWDFYVYFFLSTDLIHFRMLVKNLCLNLVSFVFSQHSACLYIFCTEATRLVMSHRALKVHCWEPRVPSVRSLRLI